MSKVDAQRAMRQARYAAHQESRAGATAQKAESPPTPARVAPPEADVVAVVTPPPVRDQDETATDDRDSHLFAAAAPADSAPAAAPDGAVALCGHRNIGNKTCSRPAGHPQKSHRYS